MGVFDNIKNKAEELIGDNPDKVEEHSDQALDMAADKADAASDGKFADHVETGRSAIDERVGPERQATAESATRDNPMVDDPDTVNPQH